FLDSCAWADCERGSIENRWSDLMSVIRTATVILLTFGIPCLLAGCETAEQIRQADERQCSSYGFQPGTVPFAECLQRERLAARYQLDSGWGPWGPAWGPGWGPRLGPR